MGSSYFDSMRKVHPLAVGQWLDDKRVAMTCWVTFKDGERPIYKLEGDTEWREWSAKSDATRSEPQRVGNCGRCRFWQFDYEDEYKNGPYPVAGTCRYNPPQRGFPVVYSDQWCGKHEPKKQPITIRNGVLKEAQE